MIALSGTIRIHKFAASADLIVGGFMVSVWGKHNIFVIRFLIMIIKILYTIDFICCMLNRTMDCKNSLTKCCMGFAFKVIKPKNPIIQAHAIS